MQFPPKPKTPYLFPKARDKRIFGKLAKFSDKKLTREQEELITFLYSQLEDDWRTPLERFIDKLQKEI